MMYIASVFSQLERETIAERIRDNMRELARTGRWLGGTTPTGYTSEAVSSISLDGKTRKSCQLKLVPEEAKIVRKIYESYEATESLAGTRGGAYESGDTDEKRPVFHPFFHQGHSGKSGLSDGGFRRLGVF